MSEFKLGEIRERMKFLFFPKRINGKISWLCWVSVREVYSREHIHVNDDPAGGYYRNCWQECE